ncbi:MAG: hypothetical protein K2P78_09760, partial [Gemmataceae bacterium]|nr:hypothetical protein [Gemmataceae bacterium]
LAVSLGVLLGAAEGRITVAVTELPGLGDQALRLTLVRVAAGAGAIGLAVAAGWRARKKKSE